MTSLTEKMAAAMWEAREQTLPSNTRMKWDKGTPAARTCTNTMAKAALAVALEEIGEECAKVADAHATNAWEIARLRGENAVCASGRNHGGRAIAEAIRARLEEMKADL